MKLEIGTTYTLHHVRFGTAAVKILAIKGHWIDVEIVEGMLTGARRDWCPGVAQCVDLSCCTFTEPRQ
jgi:hypothetical protein